jgi:hypothetical protein
MVASQGFRCQGDPYVLLYKEDMNQKGETKGGDPQVLYSKERPSMKGGREELLWQIVKTSERQRIQFTMNP